MYKSCISFTFNKIINKTYSMNTLPKNVLIAPLNWGLGHASRCIPIIRQQVAIGNNVIIASDGGSLKLLRKEFPNLDSEELPSYGISYPKGKQLIWHLLKMSSKIMLGINEEKKFLNSLVDKYKLDLIISDNRFGMYHKGVYSIYITHQTNIQAGKVSRIANKLHQYYMSRFNEIWIPDYEGENSLAGNLSKYNGGQDAKHIGILSRFKFDENENIKDKILVVLSGPEPQRTYFEEIVLSEVASIDKEVTVVLGKVEDVQTKNKKSKVTIYNFLTSDDLEREMKESSLVIARSGYSTIMDLKALKKKAFLVPTPGQGEQVYLAKYLKSKKICNYVCQDKFSLKEVVGLSNNFTGFM